MKSINRQRLNLDSFPLVQGVSKRFDNVPYLVHNGLWTTYKILPARFNAMKEETEKGYLGTSLETFLKEQGLYEDATEYAIKRVLAFQLEQEMKEKGINKVEMAKQLKTSRSQLDRLLDPRNDKVTLKALSQAAKAVGRSLRIELQ